MSDRLKKEIAEILREGHDLTLATVRPDGAPQATTVSYASDGLEVFFGCSDTSQKAQNLALEPRVSLTVNLPYADWSQIRGLSLFGRAQRITDADELARVGEIFFAKFPEIAQYVPGETEGMAMFQITPEIISILDYGKGFGHTDEVRL